LTIRERGPLEIIRMLNESSVPPRKRQRNCPSGLVRVPNSALAGHISHGFSWHDQQWTPEVRFQHMFGAREPDSVVRILQTRYTESHAHGRVVDRLMPAADMNSVKVCRRAKKYSVT
jgi:hypothetical protein